MWSREVFKSPCQSCTGSSPLHHAHLQKHPLARTLTMITSLPPAPVPGPSNEVTSSEGVRFVVDVKLES